MSDSAPASHPDAHFEAGVSAAHCPNCGAERQGEYCQRCGQRHLDDRLTIRRLWAEFASRVFNLNRGLLGTLAGLTRHPGRVAQDYIDGRRRRYTNPLSYLLLASAFSLFMLQFSEDVIRDQVGEQLAHQEISRDGREQALEPDQDTASASRTDDSDPAVARFRSLLDQVFDPDNPQGFMELYLEGLTRYNTILTALLCIPLVLLLRLLMGPARNVAEISVFALYIVGHATVLATLSGYVLVRVSTTASLLSVVLYVALTAWASMTFWGEGISAAWRAGMAMTAAYAAYYLVVLAFALAYVFDTLIDESGYSWSALLGRMFRNLTS